MIAETTQAQSPEIETLAEEITALFKNALGMVTKRRDDAYAEAIAPLETERENLVQEDSTIEANLRELQALLPSRIRILQRQADDLLIQGNREGSEALLAEAANAAKEPAEAKARQHAIRDRVSAVESEKLAIARRVYEQFYSESQAVVRTCETGFFLTMLNGLQSDSGEFQQKTGTATNMLQEQNRLSGLTAPENSVEWRTATKWYQGRTR